MEVQKPDYQKSNSDQVVVDIDQPPIPNYAISQQHPSRRRLKFSKPRSRFEEINYPVPPETILELEEEFQQSDSHEKSSSSDDEEWYEDEEGDDGGQTLGKYRKKRKRRISKMIEWIVFIIIIACFVCSLTLNSLKHKEKWGFVTWKWCLMVMVILCGHLVSGLVVGFLVFLIERNFTLREKVLYFVYGLRRSFQNCVWLGLVLIAWVVVFPDARKRIGFLKKVFRFLIAVLIGATIWLLKIVFVKVLTSSFHVATFFDRLKETVFNHYILDTLSGSPYENERDLPRRRLQDSKTLPGRLRGRSYTSASSKRYETRRIDMERLRKLKKISMEGRATAWSVKRLVSYVMSSGLSTISSTVDDFRKAEKEITSEWEARKCARRIFKNVAKPGAKYIEEEDLLKFLKSEEVHTIFPLFEGAIDSGKIAKSSFRNWVVLAYVERKALAHSLNDTKTAIQQLHKLASAIVIIIITVLTLLVMGLATTKVLFLVTSQLLLVGFMFQNMCKTIFESIIFVFVMHPFDVGDRCVVDNVQMLVEEMNILTTVFLRYDNEKIYYPNSVLLTKPISNFRRSPDMADSVDFTLDVSTPVDDVTALKKTIQLYIESKPKYWSPKHCVIVKEIVNMDKMMMVLCVQHTMNHQNFGEKSNRRSELVFELKKIFENHGIKYHLLPREIHVTQFNATDGRISIPA